jgi:hypothetical protein
MPRERRVAGSIKVTTFGQVEPVIIIITIRIQRFNQPIHGLENPIYGS